MPCNESRGISDEVVKLCDHLVYIPMMGMSQSYNVNVALSMMLSYFDSHHILRLPSNNKNPLPRLEQDVNTIFEQVNIEYQPRYPLTIQEKTDILYKWCKESI